MSSDSPENQIDSIIKLLITPVNSIPESASPQTKIFSVINFLKSSLKSASLCLDNQPDLLWLKCALNETVLEGPSEDICWQFAKLSLQLLRCLCNQLKSARKAYTEELRECKRGDGQPAPLPPDILSIQQQKNVQNVLQFIACLGISRNLLPGVGASIQQRSKFGNLLANGDEQRSSDFDKHQMLYSTVIALNKCSEHPALGSLIFTRHLGDVLAALCQLSFVPLKKVPESEINNTAPNACSQQISLALEMRKTACELLNKLIESTYQPMVIRELLLLHKSFPSNSCEIGTTTRKSMRWLRKATQALLSERLIKEQGVQAVIRGILDFPADNSKTTPNDWAQCDVVARLVASFITQAPIKEAYAELVCAQVLNLLDVKEMHQFMRVASLTIMAVALMEPKLAQKHLIDPVIEPLLMCCHHKETQHLKPTEDELFACITKLHQIFVVGPDPNGKFAEFLCPILTLLMDMFAFLSSGGSYVRSLLQDIICFFLKHADTQMSLNSLKEFLFSFDKGSKSLKLSTHLILIHGSSGGIAVSDHVYSESDELSWLDADQTKVAATIDVLSQLQKDIVVVDFFFAILQDLTLIIHDDRPDQCVDEKCIGQSEELLLIERAQLRKQQYLRKSLLIVQTLSALCSNVSLQESILKDKLKIIHFLQVTFERGAKCCGSKHSSGIMEAETLTLAMTMLSMVIDGKEKPEMKMALKSCVNYLGVLAKEHQNDEIRTLAEELITSIGTHGVVSTSEETRTTKAGAGDLPTRVENKMEKAKGVNVSTDLGKTAPSVYQQAWEDLFDHEPSARGHALLVISKLIQARDEETIEKRDRLTVALQESLNHEDSYVYLMAIRAYESLASAFPDTVMKHLIEQYSNMELAISSELKMKLGEVLVKVTRTLGEVIPKYREPLLGAFLSATKHGDAHVRASSLSNLGEVCKGLRYSLGTCTHQIFNCLTNFIKYDPSLEVRRASVQVFALMLRGMGKDSLKILESQMKDIYRLLKLVYQTDKDDVIRLHAQLALEELDVICREFLFPRPSMEKKILVLNPT